MSAEIIVKKRGRPKKIVPEPIEVDIKAPEIKKATSRSKSTAAAPKPTKIKVPTSANIPVVKKPISKPAVAPKVVSKSVGAAPPSKEPTATETKYKSEMATAKPPVAPESSKILQKVRELSANSATQQTDASNISSMPTNNPPKTTKPPHTPPINPTPLQASKTFPKTSPSKVPTSKASTSKPSSMASKPSPQTSKPSAPQPNNTVPPPKPRVPIAAFNSAVVSNINQRAGARPNSTRSKALPQSYNTVARKVTFAIVAMPIAIVTSYVLYERLVLGENKKKTRSTCIQQAYSSISGNLCERSRKSFGELKPRLNVL